MHLMRSIGYCSEAFAYREIARQLEVVDGRVLGCRPIDASSCLEFGGGRWLSGWRRGGTERRGV